MMSLKKLALAAVMLAVAPLALAGSAAEVIRTHPEAVSLSRSGSAYVMVPADGRLGDNTYNGSGSQAAQALVGAFSRYITTSLGRQGESLDEARKSARKHSFTYILMPTILHWEDRRSQWSAQPDRVSLKVSIYDAATGKELDEAIVNNRSSRMKWGGEPVDLLAVPFSKYAAMVF